MKYHLIHITTGGEYATPLVASQLFDQAQIQATKQAGDAPATVSAWITSPFRELFNSNAKTKVTSLRQRCPGINISMIGGISRLGEFPAMLTAIFKRIALGSAPAIYHCRGEYSTQFAIGLRKFFPGDKIVLDVRGFWPAELLYKRGIEIPHEAKGEDLADYKRTFDFLKATIAQVDAVTTVSDELRALLVNDMAAPVATTVVPCCVKHITDDSSRASVRSEMGFSDDDIVVVYSGTAAPYQHLDDLTLPFLYELSKYNKSVRILILSPDMDKVSKMLAQYDFPRPVVLKNVPQAEVAVNLSAADVGILLRKPTVVNKVANPVKIAEYLAAGLSIIAEKGVGGIPQYALDKGAIVATTLAEAGKMNDNLQLVGQWLNTSAYKNRSSAREVARKYYDWNAAVDIHRATYSRLLKR